MPYPFSNFYFDIKFGNRLYSKEKNSFEFNLLQKLVSNFYPYMDQAFD